MGVRLARPEDITAALKLGRITLERSTLCAELFDLQARKLMVRACNDLSMGMWVAEHKGEIVGFFMACKEQHWFSRSKYASDICFVVDPKHGNYAPSLIKRFIKWAKSDPKVTDVMLGISSGLDKDERTGRMYQNIGFTKVGGVYSLLETPPCQA